MYIYLCVRYQTGVSNAVTHLAVASANWPFTVECSNTLIDVDLNQGAGGTVTLKFCYHRYADARWADESGVPLKDVWFWSTATDPGQGGGSTIQQGCKAATPPNQNITSVRYDPTDLNKSSGGKYIYTCLGR